jgi:AraC-like DNA-binding protein
MCRRHGAHGACTCFAKKFSAFFYRSRRCSRAHHERLSTTYEPSDPERQLPAAVLCSMVAVEHAARVTPLRGRPTELGLKRGTRAEQVKSLIAQDPRRSGKSLAREFELSAGFMSREFKREVGLGFGSYTQRIRRPQAPTRLCTPTQSLSVMWMSAARVANSAPSPRTAHPMRPPAECFDALARSASVTRPQRRHLQQPLLFLGLPSERGKGVRRPRHPADSRNDARSNGERTTMASPRPSARTSDLFEMTSAKAALHRVAGPRRVCPHDSKLRSVDPTKRLPGASAASAAGPSVAGRSPAAWLPYAAAYTSVRAARYPSCLPL